MKQNLLFNQASALSKRLAMVLTMLLTIGIGQAWGADTWTLVKDVSELAVGDEVVIAASSSNYALGTTQNSNNRAAVSITKSDDNITWTTDVQVLTLEEGKTSGTFAFYTGSGYLYAASSSSNYLRTETTLSANSSWNISITSAGIATIKATGSNTRNWLRYNGSNNPVIFSCYSSGQNDVAIYKKQATVTNTLSSITLSGQTTTYNVGDSFSFDGTCTAKYSDGSTKTVTPTSVSSPDMNNAGTPTVTVSYTEGGITVKATYTITVSAVSSGDGECTWELVTDASTLKAGDRVVIAAKDYSYAISTTQNGNNRGQASVTKNTSNNTITFGDDVQILTLEEGTESGTLAFNTGVGYLYAASSSKNYMRTETTLSDNSSWEITIDSDGVATIIAQGTNTRNELRYNSSNNPPIFSCYSGGQNDVVIYKEVCTGGSTETLVTLHPNGGTISEDDWKTTDGGDTYTKTVETTSAVTLPTPTKDGYDFGGWYENSGFTGSAVTAVPESTEGEKTYHAKWNCIAPISVTVTPTNENGWRYSIGETISLEATATGGSADAYSYQWQKYIVNTWTDIEGAINQTYTKTDCGTGDGGTYRCVVSTGDGCSTESDGYWVRVFTLAGNFESNSEWNDEKIIWSTEDNQPTIGTVTLTLPANATYEFKVADNDGRWFGNPGTINATTDWWGFGVNDNNCTLQTKQAGEYIFTIDVEHAGDPNGAYVNVKVTFPTTQIIYFKPATSGTWADDAKFTIYSWGSGDPSYTPLEDKDCGGIYSAEISTAHTSLLFIKANNYVTNFEDITAQTIDLTAPTGDKVLYDMASTNITQLYLQPNSKWKDVGARFAAYFFKQGDDSFGNKWMSMSDSDSDGIYDCSIPTDKAYPNVIFCRMNGSNSTNDWNNKWNQTGDLAIPTDGKNLFDKPNDTWDGATTSWSTIYDNSKWTTYTPNYTVTFNANGHGTAPEDQCITDGGKVTNPGSLSATGYTFGGWYEEAGCTNAWDFANDVVAEDIILYAKWTANIHTLTWDVDGGNPLTGTYTSGLVAYGTVIVPPATPTRTGYTFNGWSPAFEEGTTMPDYDLTYTAQWKFIPTLSWSASSCTAALEADNDYPDLTTNPADLTGITYSSSDESVATIDPNTGEITLVGVGETTITASFAGNGTYAPAADASYTLNVVESNCRWVEVTDNTTLEDGDEVVITMTLLGTSYVLPNKEATNEVPEAIIITNTTSFVNDYIWIIGKNGNNLTFESYNYSGKFLTCNSSASDGVRVNNGANKTFVVDDTYGYLKNTTNNRYLGVHRDNIEWCSYALTDAGNFPLKIAGQTLKFYKRECLDPTEVWVEGNLTNVTCTPQLPQIIAKDGGSITLTFTAAEGYALPTSVSVEMGSTTLTTSWNRTTGKLTINAPAGGFTDNVLVTVEALQVKTVTFSVDSEDTAPAKIQAEENTDITLPAFTTNLTCVNFVGWTDAASGYTHGTDNLYKAGDSYTVTDDITLKAVYAASGGFVLVTDVANLAVGDRVIIVSAIADGDSKFWALSTTQNDNNRGQEEVQIIDNTIEPSAGVQILTLETGTQTGTHAFNTGNGYLYAASSSSNHLKTQTTNDANGSWTIEIDNAGIATIKAQGSNTRNWLRYNSGSSIFSCYASGQADVSIYKESITDYTTDPECVMYNVTLCTPTNGTISVDKTIVDPYGSTILTFVPATGYMLDVVTITSGTAEVGTVSYTSNQTSDGTVKISNIQSDIEVCATFKAIPYYKVTFIDMNADPQTSTEVFQSEFGGDITAPATASAGCDVTWTFIGWAPSNSLNGTTEVPANFVEAGGTISGANITNNNLIYYSVYSNSSDGTPPFSIGKSGTYYFKAITENDEVYYATGELNSSDRYPTNSTPNIPFLLTYNSTTGKYTIKNTLSDKYLAPDSYEENDLTEQDASYSWDVIQPTLYAVQGFNAQAKTGEYLFSYTKSDGTSVRYLYCNESYFDSWSRDNSKYALYLEPASEMHYYNASSCTELVTMSFHNPFDDPNALKYEDGYPEGYYKNSEKKNISTFPTLEYAGWTFIGWTAGTPYNDVIGEDNLNDENSSASAPTQDIYKTGGGLVYYLGGDVTMYPVFTKFEDNEPFDMVNGGDYYIYYIADGDIGTSVDEYGAAHRIYAGGWESGGTNESYGATQSCAEATLFTFTKLSNGKWTIYDNNKGKYLCADATNNNLALNATTATNGEWTITVHNGNQVNAVSKDGYTLSAQSQDATSGTFKNYATSNFNNNSEYYHRVYLGTCTERVYSSDPTNKPAITLSGEPMVTSTADQSIRAQGELSISATKLAANGTITLTADNADVYFSSVKDANFTQATKPLASLTLNADEKGKLAMTTVYVHYKPTSTSSLGVQTANITATTGTEGEEDYATAETTAHVRNLPAKFVIATKVGAIWYALPADLTTASNPLGVVIEVDETNMTATAPNSCTYTLFPVKTTNTEYDRYEEYGDRLRFSAVNNSYKGLWANNSKTDLTINNDMVIDQASDGQTGSDLANNSYYEWKVTTTVVDGHWQYTLQTDQTQNQNYLRYWTSAEGTPVGPKWGTYNAGENRLYFLPVTETQPFEYDVVEWYPTKMLIQTDAAITSPTVKIRGEEVASPVLTSKGGQLYEISNLPLETNPNKLLQVSFTADAVNYVNAKVVPIILSREAKSITGEPFATLTQKVYQYADIVVRDGATLTIDGGTDVANTLLGMTIYPTAKVSVAEGKKLSVHNLTFFGGIDEIYDGSAYTINKYGVPQLSLKGILNKTITNMDYIMRVNLDQMYQVGVPYDVNLSDITYWDGTTMTLGDNLYVSAYDGQKRANREEKSWVWETDFTEKVLKAGIGYTISADKQDAAHEYSIIRMPMKNNIASGDTEAAKSVMVVAYDNQKGVTITDNHKGWNYLSNPYMVAISGAEADSKLVVGYLRETGTGPWEWVDDTYRYVTIPSDDGKWYDQQKFEEATLLPFKSFFLQIAESGELSFALASRQSAPARYLQSSNEQREVEFEVLLANDTCSDNLGFLIGEDYTPAYEINADLEKMIGSMSVYTIYNGYNLAYNALSPTNAAEQIPIGYVVPTVGEYTFALDESSDIEDVEHIYLIDYETSAITDLVTDVYTFTTLEQKSDTRFAINVALKSKDNTATGLDNMNTNGELPTKFIYQDKIYILHHGVIYDATGKRVITINK